MASAPALVQYATVQEAGGGGAPNPITVTLSSNPTPGNLLVFIGQGGGETVSSVYTQGFFVNGADKYIFPNDLGTDTPLNNYNVGVAFRTVRSGDGQTWSVGSAASGTSPSFTAAVLEVSGVDVTRCTELLMNFLELSNTSTTTVGCMAENNALFVAFFGGDAETVTVTSPTMAVNNNSGTSTLGLGYDNSTAGFNEIELALGTGSTNMGVLVLTLPGKSAAVSGPTGATGATGSGGGGGGGGGLFSQVMSATPTLVSTGFGSSPTWVDQYSGASVSDSAVGVTIAAPSGSGNLTGIYQAVPGTPYKATVLVASTRIRGSFDSLEFGWYNGTDKIHSFVLQSNNGNLDNFLVAEFNDYSSFNTANFTTPSNQGIAPMIWFQLEDDGTDVYFRFSFDGVNFTTVYSIAKSSGWLGGSGYNNILFALGSFSVDISFATILSWDIT